MAKSIAVQKYTSRTAHHEHKLDSKVENHGHDVLRDVPYVTLAPGDDIMNHVVQDDPAIVSAPQSGRYDCSADSPQVHNRHVP